MDITVRSVEDLMALGYGYIAARALHIVGQECIADQFEGEQPRSIEELSKAIQASPVALRRLLRALCPYGIFKEHSDGTFSLMEAGRLLRSDHPSKARDLLFCEGCRWASFADLDHTLKTGEPGFQKHYGKGYFDYIAEDPNMQASFDAHMEAVSEREDPLIAKALPLQKKQSCVDVGGGKGGVIRALLELHPDLKCGRTDLPGVAKEEMEELSERFSGRFSAIEGSFFESLNFESETLILKRVLHDWGDEACVNILSRCKEALLPGGELYIVETILQGHEDTLMIRLFDLLLLSVFGGFERTKAEYETLLGKAGLKLSSVIPTETSMAILVATRKG